MFRILIFFFAELWLLIEVGHAIGFLGTVFEFIASGMFGMFFLRMQSIELLSQFRQRWNISHNAINERHLMLRSIGAVLLIIPGFMSDFLGVLLLLPWIRQWLIARMDRRSKQNAHGSVQIIHSDYDDTDRHR